MKKFFRTLAIILCLGIITPLVVPNIGSETVQAKTKIKLNCTKKTIYKGDIFKLKITGTKKKVKWSSSNKTIATVSSKGVVKGIGEGTAKITAKVGKKKYTCKVNVNIIIKLNQTNLKLNEGNTYQLNTIVSIIHFDSELEKFADETFLETALPLKENIPVKDFCNLTESLIL